MTINNFSGDYKFLSNFYECDVEFEGLIYPTSEHAFQAAKTFDENERRKFLSTKDPFIAKKMGQKLNLRPDWEEVKNEIMTTILREKFKDEELKKLLLETGQKDLVEDNTWHDNYWGNCICEREQCKVIGKNSLGLILQKVRTELSDIVE